MGLSNMEGLSMGSYNIYGGFGTNTSITWFKHVIIMWNKGRRGVKFEQFLTLHSIYVLMVHS